MGAQKVLGWLLLFCAAVCVLGAIGSMWLFTAVQNGYDTSCRNLIFNAPEEDCLAMEDALSLFLLTGGGCCVLSLIVGLVAVLLLALARKPQAVQFVVQQPPQPPLIPPRAW